MYMSRVSEWIAIVDKLLFLLGIRTLGDQKLDYMFHMLKEPMRLLKPMDVIASKIELT